MKACLVVNPSAGGGRAGRALPGVQSELERLGIEHRVERTRSLEHAGELAIAATAAGEITATLGGDGLISAVAGALKHSSGVVGVLHEIAIGESPGNAQGIVASELWRDRPQSRGMIDTRARPA